MYIKKKSTVMFRNYDSFCYITDNRNFGYKKTNDNDNDIGDKILSKSGAVFFSVLDDTPQHIDILSEKIKEKFSNIDIETVKIDANEFYHLLEKDGFVVVGDTINECKEKDSKFSYKFIHKEESRKEFYRNFPYKTKSTQDFFEEYFEGKPQLISLHIEITSKCNERCIHCYIPHENKIKDIDSELLYKILMQCKDMNVLHLTVSGGEPMLHKNFYDFLKKCREYNFSVNILSNLTLIDDKLVHEMKKNPLLGVQVSLYSMDNNVHDEITQTKGSFEKTKSAILKLIKNDIPLQISCPIINKNKHCYFDVVEWAKNHNVNVVDDYIIIAKYDHTIQNLEYRLSINEVKEVINKKISLDSKYLEKIERDAKNKNDINPDDFVCSVCSSSICISENGNVYPCAGWQDYILGNIKYMSLCEIWNTSSKIQFLRELRKRDFPKCIQCSDKEFCTMCMVRNANESSLGDPLAVNEYFCEIARFHKYKVLKGKKQYEYK